jgi:hypothetical protein
MTLGIAGAGILRFLMKNPNRLLFRGVRASFFYVDKKDGE